MRKNHISDEYALQSYVIEYVGKYLKKHHKRLIGWDEILEGGIGREAVIMSWRGVKGGITAAKSRKSSHYGSQYPHVFKPLSVEHAI